MVLFLDTDDNLAKGLENACRESRFSYRPVTALAGNTEAQEDSRAAAISDHIPQIDGNAAVSKDTKFWKALGKRLEIRGKKDFLRVRVGKAKLD